MKMKQGFSYFDLYDEYLHNILKFYIICNDKICVYVYYLHSKLFYLYDMFITYIVNYFTYIIYNARKRGKQ